VTTVAERPAITAGKDRPVTPGVSQEQLRTIKTLLETLGYTQPADCLDACGKLAGRVLAQSADLTPAEARTITATLQACDGDPENLASLISEPVAGP
jgi:peptidoglycan hydrolase-like protein with peptidoglycan-binding domain